MRPPCTLTLTANHCGLTPASSSKQTFSMSKKADCHETDARDDGFNADHHAKEARDDGFNADRHAKEARDDGFNADHHAKEVRDDGIKDRSPR